MNQHVRYARAVQKYYIEKPDDTTRENKIES
jgi:hypothetical protein